MKEQLEQFDILLAEVTKARIEHRWVDMFELSKQLERVAFRIYMMTDEG